MQLPMRNIGVTQFRSLIRMYYPSHERHPAIQKRHPAHRTAERKVLAGRREKRDSSMDVFTMPIYEEMEEP